MLPQVELEDERAQAAASAQDAKEAQVAVTSLKAAMQLERHKAFIVQVCLAYRMSWSSHTP